MNLVSGRRTVTVCRKMPCWARIRDERRMGRLVGDHRKATGSQWTTGYNQCLLQTNMKNHEEVDVPTLARVRSRQLTSQNVTLQPHANTLVTQFSPSYLVNISGVISAN